MAEGDQFRWAGVAGQFFDLELFVNAMKGYCITVVEPDEALDARAFRLQASNEMLQAG